MAAAFDSRSSRTSAALPFLLRYALTSASAFCGSSGCTGFAAYSGDTNVMLQPPNGFHKQGIEISAAAGVASEQSNVAAVAMCLPLMFGLPLRANTDQNSPIMIYRLRLKIGSVYF